MNELSSSGDVETTTGGDSVPTEAPNQSRVIDGVEVPPVVKSPEQPRTLRLTLKRKWFDMIASGEKREEYRMPGKWILSRLDGKSYDRIEFKNGYGPNVPTMEAKYLDWSYGYGRREWGGGSTPGQPLIVINFGDILSVSNYINQ